MESKIKTEVEDKGQNDNVELKSFTDVAIDERTESKAMESKNKTGVEQNSPLLKLKLGLI